MLEGCAMASLAAIRITDDDVEIFDVISAIGSPQFPDFVRRHILSFCRVKRCVLLSYQDGQCVQFGSSHEDGVPPRAHLSSVEPSGPTTFHIDVAAIAAPTTGAAYRQILINDSEAQRDIRLSLQSGAGTPFTPDEVRRLLIEAKLLLSLVTKQFDIVAQQEQMASAISSLDQIDRYIANAPEQLSPREAQVCARILYGQTTTGIALDLGIGTESVMTYRKRAYRRLEIASHRELLCWYLSLRARDSRPVQLNQNRFEQA
jgi:DNA-binding CsgD family transcriptional regulator